MVLVGLAIMRLGAGNGLVHDLATTAAFFAVSQLALDPDGLFARTLNSPRPERAIIANPIGLVVGQRHSASGPPLLAPLVALGGWLNWILKILEQKVHVLQFIE
jgi:hypothetical protein